MVTSNENYTKDTTPVTKGEVLSLIDKRVTAYKVQKFSRMSDKKIDALVNVRINELRLLQKEIMNM